jgi:hypothetical protein
MIDVGDMEPGAKSEKSAYEQAARQKDLLLPFHFIWGLCLASNM